MLLVVLSHAGIGSVSGGFVGVDVFFVISGFLITGILVDEVRRTARVSIASFYARRARRILPAATVLLLTVLAVSCLVFTPAALSEVTTPVLWAAFFAANIYSSTSGSNYFAEDALVSPVQHYWSLAVEEQFYLVWPPLIAVVLLAGARRKPPGSLTRRAPAERWTAIRIRRVTAVIAVLSALSLTWSVWLTAAEPTRAYYSTFTRGWELGAGALLALSAKSIARWPRRARSAAFWAGMAAIAAAAGTFSARTPFPGYSAVLPVAGAALVIASGIRGPAPGARWVLDTPALRWVGDISYSLYLWHWPFLVLPELYLARDLTPLERVALVAGATVTAAVSHRFVELPARNSTRWFPGRVRPLVLWPATAAMVAAAVAGGQQAVRVLSPKGSPDIDHVAAKAVGSVVGSVDPAVDAVAAATDRARAQRPLPAGLRPSLQDLNDDVSRLPPGCGVERDDPAVSTCVLGDPHAERTIVLFGDSHVIMWLQPVERLAKARGWRIIPVQKASCFPVDATLWRNDRQRPYTECDAWRNQAYREIARIRPDRIITSGLLTPGMTDPATGRPGQGAVSQRIFAEGVQSTLARLRRVTGQVYVIGGTPNLDKPAGECLGTRKATMATCARPVEPTLKQRNATWRRAAAEAGASFIDPVPWLCDELCPIVVRDVVVYRDTNHITRTFADTLRSQLARTLKL